MIILHTFRNYRAPPAEIRDILRNRFGECCHPDHRTHFVFQPVLDNGTLSRTCAMYRKWQALAYKRFGRTWNAMKQRKLDRLRAEITAMERERSPV